jgi:hypothetical protein
MNERLLSEQGMKGILPTGFDVEATDENMCKAQDTKTTTTLIEQLLNYATDYYSLSAWDFVKKYPGIETDVSDGQWIAQYLKKLKERVQDD